MPTITLSNEFFVKERNKAYEEWKTAFWRELLQNSLDASSTKIEIFFTTDEDEKPRIMFLDNGHGMSREVIEDVYLCLGRTTKDGAGSLGGFGRARILTCFSMDRWRVISGNVIVDGRGIDYEISEPPAPPLHGTEVTVTLPSDTNHADMRHALTELLDTCTLDCEVQIDGVPFTDWLQPTKSLIDIEANGKAWGHVHETSERHANEILVRVRGLTMFTKWSKYPRGLVLQIDPALSRTVLSSNRDGLMYTYSRSMDEFANALATEGYEALTPKLPRIVKMIEGQGMRRATPRPKGITLDLLFERKTKEEPKSRLVAPAGFAPQRYLWDSGHDRQEVIEERHRLDWIENFVIEIDSQKPAVRAAAEEWNPLNWKQSGNSWPLAVRRKMTTIRAWMAACEYMVDLFAWQFQKEFCWTVGWTFHDTHFAECRTLEDGYAFLLNPVKLSGEPMINIDRMDERKKLLGMAAHEVCHIDCDNHNAAFADRITQIIYVMDQAEGLRRISKAVKAHQ